MLTDGDKNFDDEPGLELTGRQLLNMSAGSLVFYLFIATLLFYFFHDGGLFEVFMHGYSFGIQLLTGIVAGAAAAGIILIFSTRRPVGPVLDDFSIFRIIKKAKFTWFDRIQVSFFAGVGEELLFRGAIQPLIGVWLTSFIFIAIHGYISFRTTGHALFTILLFGLSMMLGYLYIYAGLVAAMVAHAVYDLLMLWWVSGVSNQK
jgi:uncharacterized protein